MRKQSSYVEKETSIETDVITPFTNVKKCDLSHKFNVLAASREIALNKVTTTELPSKPSNSQLSDFEIMERLGDGSYSCVYKAKRISTGEIWWIKKVKIYNLTEKEKHNALNEVRILSLIKNNNIISCKEAFLESDKRYLWIVLEYADGKDLYQQVCDKAVKQEVFKEDDIWRIFLQILKGLYALHENKIMHRDIKSANIFMFNDMTAKLGDMNVSRICDTQGLNYTQTGTPYYASPEVWKDKPYDFKSDIWSLGWVLYELAKLRPPFQGRDMQSLYEKVSKGQYSRISK